MHCKPPSLRFFVDLSLSQINYLNIGFKHLACPSDMWPPLSLLFSTHSLVFNSSPLGLKCLCRRHASNHLHLRTMASSKSFIFPFAPFDSLIFNEPPNASSDEVLLVTQPSFDEGILSQRDFVQVISWEVLSLLRSYVKEGFA